MEQILELLVPDIGDFQNVPVIEVLVKAGDPLTPDAPVVTLESDKASMEVPAEVEGEVLEIVIVEGDVVSEGSLLLRYRQRVVGEIETVAEAQSPGNNETSYAEPAAVVQGERLGMPIPYSAPEKESSGRSPKGAAAPSVRRLARELGVDLADVVGTGTKGRLQKEDILAHVKQVMQSGGFRQMDATPAEAAIDFSVFGPIMSEPLSRIQKISGAQLTRNAMNIPHVTSFAEADITELDQFRRELNEEQPTRLTLLSFMIKAVQHSLQVFPRLNSSLQGDQLIVKGYFHIGFAVDTAVGLMVPVIRDVDSKGVVQIGREVAELAELARNGKLKAGQMQGGSFTISSIGSIGGTHFTPIINAPEVAILGLGQSKIQPVWDSGQWVPRNILPLSLSWDHRALDGVAAARFNAHLVKVLKDFRRVVL